MKRIWFHMLSGTIISCRVPNFIIQSHHIDRNVNQNKNGEGILLDIEGFVKIIGTHARHEVDPEAMKEKIMADVLKWCDNRRDDDMTLVIVKRKEVVDGKRDSDG